MKLHTLLKAREDRLIAQQSLDASPLYKPQRHKERCLKGASCIAGSIHNPRTPKICENLINVIVPVSVLTAIFLSAPAWAAIVTNNADNGTGSLRAAIAAAGPGETINFAASVGSTITLTSGELLIDKDLIISGPGAGNLTIQRSTAMATPDFRIFHVSLGTVTISGLTVSDGRADIGGGILNEFILTINNCTISENFATELGGGLGNLGTMTMSNCVISNNSVASGSSVDGGGGGVFNFTDLTATNCSVSNNSVQAGSGARALAGGVFNDGTLTADSWMVNSNSVQAGSGADGLGGGIYNDGTLTFTNSKISGNSATGGIDAAGSGGGIFNISGSLTLTTSTVGSNTATGGAGSSPGAGSGGGIANDSATLELVRSTVSANSAVGGDGGSGSGGSGEGGGLANTDGTVDVRNSTVSGNLAQGGAGTPAGSPHGGGIFNLAGTVFITNSTIAANVVPSGFSEDGGGIYNNALAHMQIKNTIVAANTATADLVNNVGGTISSGGFNLIGTTTGTISPGPSDQFNITASVLKIGPLQNNGGPTFTHALLCESPAFNAGDNTDAPATDQRGFPRIVDGVIDIGAFEGKSLDLRVTKQCRIPPSPPGPPQTSCEVPPCGGSVIYKYSVANSGGTPVTNVVLTDDIFGGIAGPFDLAANETKSFEVTKQMTQTTTNIATATAEGCQATSNPVTVTVTRGNACPRTLGFWKNHTSDWPVSSLMLGGKTYTKAELIKILNAGGEGDASVILARQLIATKLSIANCSDPAPIDTRVEHADTLLSAFPGKLPYRVSPSSQTGRAMISDATELDRYNNSRVTPNCTGPK